MKAATKNKIIAIAMVMFLCGINSYVSAEEVKDPATSSAIGQKEMEQNVESEKQVELQDAKEDVTKDAILAIQETENALQALYDGNKEEALTALEKVIGKLDILLALNPELSLIPIDARIETLNLIADEATIKDIRKEAESMMAKGYLQSARGLLNQLSSEVRVNTYHLPLQTYPLAIREIARLIDQDKIDEAKLLLAQTLNTLVITTRVIPIPVLNAQFMIAKASDITKDVDPKNLPDDKKEEALDALKKAKDELKIAELMGYGKKDREFAEIEKDIREIEGKISKDEKTVKLFDTLTKRINDFKERISKQ
jgi:hypothetical protein